MFTKALLCKARIGEEGRKLHVHLAAAGCQLPMPAFSLLSLAWSSKQPQVCVPAAKTLNVLQLILIHHTAGRRQERANEWFLLLSSHKTVWAEREWKRNWTEVLKNLLLEQHIWLLCNTQGELSCAHPKLLDFYNPLTHVSVCLLTLKLSHFKSISCPSKKLGLYTSTRTLAWLTGTGSYVNLSFNTATCFSHALLSPAASSP